MKKLFISVLAIVLAACGAEITEDMPTTESRQRPNVLLILADDMGYNELGAWGSEIRTPNLDALALDGLRFTNFHAAPLCAPARAMLLSGTTNHQAGVGSMIIKRSYDRGRELDPDLVGLGHPNYVGHISERIATLPEILQAAGYHTYMAGKWDLGRALDDSHMAAGRGFEASYILTTGAAVHLGFPDGNASGGIRRADANPYQEHGVPISKLPRDFFSSAVYTDKLIEYIDGNRGDGEPFFAYLAFTAPHWPIQVPDDWRDRYTGHYDEGYEVIRERRFARAKELGIFQADLDLSNFESAAPAWDSLSAQARKEQSRVMELYAAMIENMDHHIGRLVTYLESTAVLDNTVIIFLSDNGADESISQFSGTHTVNNRFENMGRYNSWLGYGRGWAEAATAPFRDVKGSMAEGGTRVAGFIHHSAIANPGSIDHGYLTFMDVAPTVLEITRTDPPDSIFDGRSVLPMSGKSFWALAQGSPHPVHSSDEAIGFELHGDRALIRGEWKLLMTEASGRWELYNLREDPAESNDLSNEKPILFADLIEAWEGYAQKTGVVY